MSDKKIVLIVGAGAAGISCAYYISTNSEDYIPVVIEQNDDIGGLACTLFYDDTLSDIGPHRFFTKDARVMDLWKTVLHMQGSKAKDDIVLNREYDFEGGYADPEVLDNVFLRRRRFSRIYYKNHFYDYPLKINFNSIKNLGIFRTALCGLSYIKSSIFKRKENNLEDFIINRFGKALYSLFFEFYTQKVWGRHPKNISKEWGQQRIKGLSLWKTILSKFNNKQETSLINEYFYPKLGAGQMWAEMADVIISRGGQVRLNSRLIGINIKNDKVASIVIEDKNGIHDMSGDFIISSMPVKDLINACSIVPQEIKTIANDLPYRDYQLISFKVKNFNLKNNTDWKTIDNICPDSWIYIQDRGVNVGRIYIPKNFSPYLQSDINDTLICMEYFCDKGDDLWNMTDEQIFEYGINELIKIHALATKEDVIKSYRHKIEKAYPAYFDSYKDFDKIKSFINSIENLYCIGRNGQHKYNNMDHSTLSGIVAADAIINGNVAKDDVWNVNTEQSYQETN